MDMCCQRQISFFINLDPPSEEDFMIYIPEKLKFLTAF